jgi:methionyl-tRNA formyltransferase
MLIENLPLIIDRNLTPKQQDDSKATYSNLIKKPDGNMDFNLPAEVLERQVRAYAQWPKSKATIHGHEVTVCEVRVVNGQNDGALVLQCRDSWLEIVRLIGPSGRLMSGADYLRGYPV